MNDTSATDRPSSLAAERLRSARRHAGYKSASAAARVFGWGEAAYRHHENGTRAFNIAQAIEYAKAFEVRPGWLLDLGGTGFEAGSPVPVASFYMSVYAEELGEDADVRLTIDQVYENLGHVLVPQLRISNERFAWIKEISGLPPFHLFDPSYIEMPLDKILEGYLFAWRVNERNPRSALPNDDIVFVDSSARVMGLEPELWLVRDEDGPWVTWAQQTTWGDALLLPRRTGDPAAILNSSEHDVIGKIVWRMGLK